MKNFERDRKEGFFGSGQDGDIEHAKQVQAFENWSDKYPDKNPLDYYEQIANSKDVGSWFGTDARETRQQIEVKAEPIPEEERQAIIQALKDAGYQQTEANIRHVYEQNK